MKGQQSIYIGVYKDYQGRWQMEIGDDDGGHRLYGPSFIGRSQRVFNAYIDEDDAQAIVDYLERNYTILHKTRPYQVEEMEGMG